MAVTLEPRYLGSETLKRVREALERLDDALASVGADKLRVSVVDALPESPFNLTRVAGTALTGRDWSSDFAKLQNLDVALSTRASESTLAGIKAQTDKLTFDANNFLRTALASDEVGLLKKADLSFDASGYLNVNVQVTANPPNLDVELSTRASEATLANVHSKLDAIDDALASVGGDQLRVDVISAPFSGSPDASPPSQGVLLLGYDGTYARQVKTTSDGKLVLYLP